VGGMVGMIMTGIFAKDVGLTSGSARTFLVHCGALIFVAAFSFAGSWVLYRVTDMIIPLRVSEEQEEIGLDLSRHGEMMEEAVAPRAPALAKIA
jgi:Amt family ammonium transporter